MLAQFRRGNLTLNPCTIFSNMTIRCGDTGLRDNLCWVAEGDLHVDATPFRGISDETVEGVRMEGIVFIGARQYSTWATKPGDITYSDCEWKVRKNGNPTSCITSTF